MAKWELFEEYFLLPWDEAGHSSFKNEDVKVVLEMSGRDATQMIQAYLDAMLHKGLNTLFVITRSERTSNSVWTIGHTVKHARAMTEQFANDVENRILIAITPMLDHIVTKNPRAQPQATRTTIKIGRLVQQLAELAR